MTDITSFSPLWGVWNIEQLLGSGTFGDVYKAKRVDSGREYLSAIKHISIPPRSTNMQALRADGIVTDEASAMHYCDGLLGTLVKEIDICYELKGYTNFVSYEDHLIVPRQGDIGYDVFIRMELLTSLQDYIDSNGITVGAITKLCEDMCTAINVLEQKRIIHRDIKPANIFVSATGDFKLGDFGVARHMEGLGSMSVKGTYNYMAPEILKGGTVSSNSDLYSLGLVLYRLLNSNRAPFLPPPPAQISYEEDQSALDRRLSGEPLNPPTKAELSLPLTNVIMRACEYEPGRRFQSANEMKQALQDFRNTQSSNTQNSNFDLDATVAVERSAMASSFGSWNQQGSGKNSGSGFASFSGSAQIQQGKQPVANKTMFTVLFSIVGVIALLLIVILVLLIPRGNEKEEADTVRSITQIEFSESPMPTPVPTPTPTPRPAIDVAEIENIISAYTALSNVAVSIADLNSGEVFSTSNADRSFIASGLYLPVYIAIGGSNSSSSYSAYISNILSRKDNQSANVLIDNLGGTNVVNEILWNNGYTSTTLGRYYGDVNASNRGYENYTTAVEATKMLQYVYNDGGYTKMYSDLSSEGISLPSVDSIYAHTGQGIGTAYNLFAVVVNSNNRYAVSILTEGTGSTWDTAKKNAIPIISSLLKNIQIQMNAYWN